MENSLIVSEKFYSIQGEGQTMGFPAMFLRLAGCNLLCKSAHWVCDSIEVWQKGIKTDFNEVFSFSEVASMREGVHLIITGGEPLLHQAKICDYIEWFKSRHGFKPTIEIETNGTIIPNESLLKIVDYWNCSPKLENSGESYKRRVNPEAIKTINSRKNSIFKFVVNQIEDAETLLEDYREFISLDSIYIMPAGESQIELEKTRLIAVNICKVYGFKYSERLHIIIWNKKTGV